MNAGNRLSAIIRLIIVSLLLIRDMP